MVRTIVWLPICLAGSVLLVLGALILSVLSRDAFYAIVRNWGRWNRWCARWLLGQRLEIRGTIPVGPGFLVFKHEAMFETIDLPLMFGRPVVFAKQELFDIPVWGRLAKLYGLIPIARDAGASALRTMRRAALDAIAAGRPVILFPEGTRVAHGQSPALRSGFAGVYKLLGQPVIPVAVRSGHLLRDGWIRVPGTIVYQVGTVIPAGLPRDEAEARVHAAINALND